MKAADTARFDTKLPKSQKERFEYAASIGGFRSLTEFVLRSAEEKANEIIKKHESFLQSEKDREVFFDAISNPAEPNEKLKEAFASYRNKYKEEK